MLKIWSKFANNLASSLKIHPRFVHLGFGVGFGTVTYFISRTLWAS